MDSPASRPIDPTRCPLCGEDNACGSERGAATCWCASTRIPASVLERVPPHLIDRACVCARCAADHQNPDETPVLARTPSQEQ